MKSTSLNPNALEYIPIQPGVTPSPFASLPFFLLQQFLPPPPSTVVVSPILVYPHVYAYCASEDAANPRPAVEVAVRQRRRGCLGQRPPRLRGRGKGKGKERSDDLKLNEKIEKKSIVTPLKRDEHKTTIMIKNIPYHCSRNELLTLLDKFCLAENNKAQIQNEGSSSAANAYDFVYLPVDFKSGKGRGFAFVNFTNSSAVWKFFNAFHLTKWEFTRRPYWPKLLEIVSAKMQGKEALMDHLRHSVFYCNNDEYLPVGFSPPRDGSGKPVQQTVVGNRCRSDYQN